MEVNKTPVLSVFDSKQRLEVPLFQRQYVWNEEQHWTPLWEDIERKFGEILDKNLLAPHHFLGAMVLDQKQTSTGNVVIRQVIDGQQRLTTFQLFLAAYRDFCRSQGCEAVASECDEFIFNTGRMSNPDVDKFKIWPTQLDRPQFRDVTTARSREALLKLHPQTKRPYARKFDPRPAMVEAYLFFHDRLNDFFLGDEGEKPQASDIPLVTRTDECFQALKDRLMVVVIDLQEEDDPQIIFETLNARGEPLLPADLLRNYIFHRARRANLEIENVYQTYWSGFDDSFWREEVSQGRLYRPRSDLFMQHFLSSRQGRDVPIKHLYVEYRHWLERAQPFPNVTEELKTLAEQREDFRRLLAPDRSDVLFRLSQFLQAFDIGTIFPLLLAVLATKPDDQKLGEITDIVESYLLRRTVCGLTTKNYNRLFLSLVRTVSEPDFSAASLTARLLAQTSDSGVWPDDVAFRNAWLSKDAYALKNPRLTYIFTRLNETFVSPKSEKITIDKTPSIEHLLPQGWVSEWPLPDSSKGMTMAEAAVAAPGDPRAAASAHRDALLQTMGNLTIIMFELNAAQSNSGWTDKRREMGMHSLLPLNQAIVASAVWDETTIVARGADLFTRALALWPR